jgi:hypothetical protein
VGGLPFAPEPELKMPVRPRTPNEIARQVMPLLILGIGMAGSNTNFTIIDDEATILGAATQPVRATLAAFRSGIGQHEHPPLYDILLHFWLRLTGGAFEYLRMPSIFFFLVGLFLLARAARHLGGPSSAQAVVWLGALWPFGFHFGRLATWYAFSFFLIAGLTLAYLRYLEDQGFGRWALFFVFAVALLWTNYFGWAILGCLAIDQFFRHCAGEDTASPAILARTSALLCVAFLPLFPALSTELRVMGGHQSALKTLLNAAFTGYSFFVSESVAPWYWSLSVPAGIAVLLCVALTVVRVPRSALRFLFCGATLFLLMALTGILNTKRMLLIAPWALLPIAVAVGTKKSRWTGLGLVVALLTIGAIGWYGIYSRQLYSAPRFIEPWQKVAGETADKIQGGATVVADNPSFFFYLTYILRVPDQAIPWKFAGLLPDQVHDARVYRPADWLTAGHPMGSKMMWVRGMNGPQTGGPMDAAANELNGACGARVSRLMMRDQGYVWKERFAPELGELQWRVEVREYDCSPAGSQDILHIPLR